MPIKTVAEAMSRLEEAVLHNGPDAVRLIEAELIEVTRFEDPCTIRPLLRLLDDKAEYDEVMFSLIHAAEDFNDEVYAKSLLLELPYLNGLCPKWASIVFLRALNNENTRICLVRELKSANDDVRCAVLWLSKKINERSPKFLAKTMAVMVAAR